MAMTEQAVTRKTKFLAHKEMAVVEVFPTPSFSRFSSTADLVKYGVWLSDRLRTVWNHLNERSVLGWLKGCAESNEFFFIKSVHAVSMFRVYHRALDPKPSIEEIFVFVDDADNRTAIHEGAAHYGEVKRWAKGMEAREIQVGCHSDIPRPLIEGFLGRITAQEKLTVTF